MGRGRKTGQGVAGGVPTPPRGWNWQDGDVGLTRTRNGVTENIDVNPGRQGIVSINYPGGTISGRDLDGYLDQDGEANYGKIVRDLNRGALPNERPGEGPLTAAGRRRAEIAAAPIDPFNATEEDRNRFNVTATTPAARSFAPGDVQEAWNSTSAAQLEALLPENDAAMSITRALQLPTPREMFGRANPVRKAPSAAVVKTIGDALSGAGTGYSELRRQLGIDGFPAATDMVSRRANGGVQQVSRVAKAITANIPEGTDAATRARVAALIDTIGGLGVARERNYETMILSKGPDTPKGRVLSRVGRQMFGEARRMATEVNRLLGADTRAVRGLPKPGTPGYAVYKALVSDPGMGQNIRAMTVKRPRYSEAELGILNNG